MFAYTMSIKILIYWILTKIMPVVDGIPDSVASSPEIESSNGYLSKDMVASILRAAADSETVVKTEKYDGYLFNQNRCIQFNNRILCGFDKNKGTALDDYTMIDVGNGCRTRGDRIECGYDNPVFNINLRLPAVEKRGGPGEKVEDNQQNEKNRGRPGEKVGDNQRHEKKHHHKRHHHKRDTSHDTLSHDTVILSQTPTRTPTITDPTVPSFILNRMKVDFIENKLLNSEFSKLLLKAEETSIDNVTTTKNTTEPTTSTTSMVKSLTTPTTTTTTVEPTKRKSRITSKSTPKATESTTTKATLSTTKITTTLPESLEANEISDGETITRIVRLEPVIKPKRRLLLSKLIAMTPKVPIKPTRTAFPKITKNCENTENGGALRMEGSAEKKVTTACVEQEDRVVCYDFKTDS